MHCNIYIQHFEQNDYSTMEHGTFSDIDDLIDTFDFVKVMSPKNFDLYAEEDWFGKTPVWNQFLKDFKNCDSIVIYGSDGGFVFDTIIQLNSND